LRISFGALSTKAMRPIRWMTLPVDAATASAEVMSHVAPSAS
jgi:hypothetical protein